MPDFSLAILSSDKPSATIPCYAKLFGKAPIQNAPTFADPSFRAPRLDRLGSAIPRRDNPRGPMETACAPAGMRQNTTDLKPRLHGDGFKAAIRRVARQLRTGSERPLEVILLNRIDRLSATCTSLERASNIGMSLKAVLLDIDGTLLDSNSFHAESWLRTFQHFGYEATFDTIVKRIGMGGEYLLPHFVPENKLQSQEKEIKAFRKSLFHREYIDRIVPFLDARRLLERMREQGLRIVIATSSEKDDLEVFKTLLKVHDLVEEDVTADDAEKAKPEPDIFQAALSALRVEPSEAIALGDTPWDIKAAAKAGVRAVAVRSGGWREEQLQEAGAVAVYRDVAEIVRTFDQSLFANGS